MQEEITGKAVALIVDGARMSEQVLEKQSTEGITYSTDNQYTSIVLLNAIENALSKAEVTEADE